MNLVTKREFIWSRSFAAGPKEVRDITIKAGAPVELIDDARGGLSAFVNPAYFGEPGSILYHDAVHHGCRVAANNYYAELKKASPGVVRRAKHWTGAMGAGGKLDIMSKLSRPSERDYNVLRSRENEVERAPLAERKENAAEWLRDLRDPGLISERVDWLLDGNYGQAEQYKGLQIVSSPRMNRVAALCMLIALLEWHTPGREAIAQWKKLSVSEQNKLKEEIQKTIEYHEDKWRGE